MDTLAVRRASSALYAALVLLVLAYAAVLSVFPVNSNDVFFYLEIGRRFFSGEGVPTSDVFLFTGADRGFDCYHELGAMLYYSLAHAAGGFAALIMAKTALIVATAAVPFWVSRRLDRARRPWLLPVLAFLAVYGSSCRFIERGSLFSDLFTTLLVGLIVAIRAGAGPGRAYRAAIPLLFLVWVNLHAGFIIGFVILLAWLVAAAARLLLAGDEQRQAAISDLSAAATTTAAAALLGLVNLRGAQAYGYLARFLRDPGLQVMLEHNLEFRSPFVQGYVEFLDIRVFIGVVVACLLLAAVRIARPLAQKRYGELPLFEALCLGIFAALGFTMVRFLITAAFGAVAVAAALLAARREQQAGDAGPWRLALPAAAALGIAGSILLVAANGYGSGYATRRVGLGVNMAEKPVRACEFIDEAALGVNVFNKYEFGSYMIWRWRGLRKVFAHGFVADAEYLRNEYSGIDRSASDFARIVARYRVGAFLVASVQSFQPGALPLSHRILLTDSRWHVVYSDEVATLFVRDVPENRGIIERFAARPRAETR